MHVSNFIVEVQKLRNMKTLSNKKLIANDYKNMNIRLT